MFLHKYKWAPSGWGWLGPGLEAAGWWMQPSYWSSAQEERGEDSEEMVGRDGGVGRGHTQRKTMLLYATHTHVWSWRRLKNMIYPCLLCLWPVCVCVSGHHKGHGTGYRLTPSDTPSSPGPMCAPHCCIVTRTHSKLHGTLNRPIRAIADTWSSRIK